MAVKNLKGIAGDKRHRSKKSSVPLVESNLPDLVHRATDASRTGSSLQGRRKLSLLSTVDGVPDAPVLKSLVRACRNQTGSVGRLGKVEYAGGVTSEFRGLSHRRVLPEANLVLRETMGRDQFLTVDRPLEGAHLGLGIDGVKKLAGGSIPKLNGTVSSSSTGGK